jgi:hypothetical protein
MEYYQQRRQDSNTKDVSVKEDDSLELTRSQDSVFFQGVIRAEYDWEYLIVETNCELVAFFEIFIYRFFFLFLAVFLFSFLYFLFF